MVNNGRTKGGKRMKKGFLSKEIWGFELPVFLCIVFCFLLVTVVPALVMLDIIPRGWW